jgi:hypothetical protein
MDLVGEAEVEDLGIGYWVLGVGHWVLERRKNRDLSATVRDRRRHRLID